MALWNLVIQAIILVLGAALTLWEAKPRHRLWYLSAFGLLAIVSIFIGFKQERESDARQERVETLLGQLQEQASRLKESPLRIEVVDPADAAARRKAIRERLGKFVDEGSILRDRAIQNQLSPSVKRDWNKWRAEVELYLRENLDSSYEARFKTMNIEGFMLSETIMNEITALYKILEELKD